LTKSDSNVNFKLWSKNYTFKFLYYSFGSTYTFIWIYWVRYMSLQKNLCIFFPF